MNTTNQTPLSLATVQTAKQVQKMYGSNYYAATILLPKDVRHAVFIFYAFVRLADELVDNPAEISETEVTLSTYEKDWKQCYENGDCNNEIFSAFRNVCITYNIPYHLTESFFSSMRRDLTTARYNTYDDLLEYIYGSAEVIGIILTKIFGCANKTALPAAQALGRAMQLTNIIRDVYEDYSSRGRIYIPLADLKKLLR